MGSSSRGCGSGSGRDSPEVTQKERQGMPLLPSLMGKKWQVGGVVPGLPAAALDLGDQGDDVAVAQGGGGTGPEAVDGDGVPLAGDVVGLQGLLDGSPGGNLDDGGRMAQTQNFDLHAMPP